MSGFVVCEVLSRVVAREGRTRAGPAYGAGQRLDTGRIHVLAPPVPTHREQVRENELSTALVLLYWNVGLDLTEDVTRTRDLTQPMEDGIYYRGEESGPEFDRSSQKSTIPTEQPRSPS